MDLNSPDAEDEDDPVQTSSAALGLLDQVPPGKELPRGWRSELVDGRLRYVKDATGETTFDRPFDVCGTFGCILEAPPCTARAQRRALTARRARRTGTPEST